VNATTDVISMDDMTVVLMVTIMLLEGEKVVLEMLDTSSNQLTEVRRNTSIQ
jgi:hypothetical protein